MTGFMGHVRRIVYALAIVVGCSVLADGAQAADAVKAAKQGEPCGTFGSWTAKCQGGLSCQATITIGPWRIGVCSAASRLACQSDADCPHGSCDRGVTCAGLSCPPPPPNRCTVCGDGSALRCRRAALPCPDGQVREIVEGCYGACVERATCEPAGCEYEGERYDVGASFPADDGCNTCRCEEDGTVQCTLRLCGQTCNYDDPHTSWMARDRDTCDLIDFFCPEDMTAFTDDCGCGCRDKEAGAGCDYGGVHYRAGEGFPSTDGCNTCSCTATGAVACTKRACAPQ